MLDSMKTAGAAKRFGLSLRHALPSPAEVLLRLAELLTVWESRARERRYLGEMPDRMLRDLGISRSDARRESEKPFWRV